MIWREVGVLSMPVRALVLASRSPQRRALLQQLLPADAIRILAPPDANEAGFDGLNRWSDIRSRLIDIARHKAGQIRQQLAQTPDESATVLAADTVILASQSSSGSSSPATDSTLTDSAQLVPIGQPPEGDAWREVVRNWFCQHYAGRVHWAATGVCLWTPGAAPRCEVVTTAIEFRADAERWIDWYLQTGEPLGKAGGYALQGAGSLFVTRVTGSLSNVIGLPLELVATWLLDG